MDADSAWTLASEGTMKTKLFHFRDRILELQKQTHILEQELKSSSKTRKIASELKAAWDCFERAKVEIALKTQLRLVEDSDEEKGA